MNFKLWLESKNILELDIDSILPDKDNMETAVDSLSKGMYSDDHRPIKVLKYHKQIHFLLKNYEKF